MASLIEKIERVFSKTSLRRAGIFLKNVPIISNTVEILENLPYVWDNAKPIEKVGMLVGATLILAGVALLVAATIAPLVPATPIILGIGIAGLVLAAGKMLFQQSILKPLEQKRKERAMLNEVKAIQSTMVDLQKNVNLIFKKIESGKSLAEMTLSPSEIFKQTDTIVNNTSFTLNSFKPQVEG